MFRTVAALAALTLTVALELPAGALDSPPATRPAMAPATTPAADVPALIAQLAADSFAKRQAAADALRKLGKDALPALREAAKDKDLQVSSSAKGLIDQIENAGKPVVGPSANLQADGPIIIRNGRGQIIVNGGAVAIGGGAGVQMQVSVTVVNGQSSRQVTRTANGRTIQIREDADGLQLQVTENGQTRQFNAKDAATLKREQPEAFKLYEELTNNAGGMQIEVAPGQ